MRRWNMVEVDNDIHKVLTAKFCQLDFCRRYYTAERLIDEIRQFANKTGNEELQQRVEQRIKVSMKRNPNNVKY